MWGEDGFLNLRSYVLMYVKRDFVKKKKKNKKKEKKKKSKKGRKTVSSTR